MFSLKRILDLYLNCIFLERNDLYSRHQTGSHLVHPTTHFNIYNTIGRLGVF